MMAILSKPTENSTNKNFQSKPLNLNILIFKQILIKLENFSIMILHHKILDKNLKFRKTQVQARFFRNYLKNNYETGLKSDIGSDNGSYYKQYTSKSYSQVCL